MHDHQNNCFSDFILFNQQHNLIENFQSAYYQLGFICSVQALPEQVDLEQWLPQLWKEGIDISFDDQQQATEYAQAVLTLINEVNQFYESSIPLTILNCEQWLDSDLQVNQQGIAFSSGFLAAIECFNAQWLLIEDDQQVQNLLQTSILLLSKLSSTKNVDQAMLDLFEQLPSLSEIVNILPQLITNLAHSATRSLECDEI